MNMGVVDTLSAACKCQANRHLNTMLSNPISDALPSRKSEECLLMSPLTPRLGTQLAYEATLVFLKDSRTNVTRVLL